MSIVLTGCAMRRGAMPELRGGLTISGTSKVVS
jgi:hypothetical protein